MLQRPRVRPVVVALSMLLLAGALAVLDDSASAGSTGTACATQASPDTATRRPAALHAYDDFIEDVLSAPDICASNLVTNDNLGAITIGMHIHDRSSFSAGDAYSVFLDTDSNSATGSGAGPGVPAGAEYVIEVASGTSTLRRWSGSAFDLVTPQPAIPTAWSEDYGPVLQLRQADLGGAVSFSLTLMTTNGTDYDLAPDTGGWAYALSPLALSAGRLLVSSAKAGKLLVAGMTVTRSDFEIALDEGTIKCPAKLNGKPLAGRGLFIEEDVVCGWRLPKSAAGKRVRGSVTVTFQGVAAKRSFNARVK